MLPYGCTSEVAKPVSDRLLAQDCVKGFSEQIFLPYSLSLDFPQAISEWVTMGLARYIHSLHGLYDGYAITATGYLSMSKSEPHEITLIAFDDRGQLVDIVETSRHYAYRFLSRMRRDPKVRSVAATAPKASLDNGMRAMRVNHFDHSFETIACNAFDRAVRNVGKVEDADTFEARHARLLAAHNARFVHIMATH